MNALVVLILVVTLWPVTAVPAFIGIRALMRRRYFQRWPHAIVGAALAGLFLSPALVVVGHNPWLTSFVLAWLFPQTGNDILLWNSVLAAVVFAVACYLLQRSNSRLLPDTSTSPLRAQRGAAKPGR